MNEHNNDFQHEVTDYNVRDNQRYSYSIESQPQTASRKQKKSHLGLKVGAVALAAALLTTGGGAAGALLMADHMKDTQLAVAAPQYTYTGVVKNAVGDLSLKALFAAANPAVVAIATEMNGVNVFGQTVNMPAAGSGFVISEDGYIATNNHVIEGADKISVLMSDGKTHEAKVIGADTVTDLAVLKIEAKGLPYLQFGDSENLFVGDLVAAIGNPLGELENTFTVGYVSALDREINIDGIPRTMLQTDAAINGGNSGGPLLNQDGQVIGVVSAKSGGQNVEGLGFAIPSNQAAQVIEQLIKGGKVTGRPYLGVSLTMRNGYGISVLYVADVETGGAAEKAGIQKGDIILAADGTETSTRDILLGVLSQKKVGDSIKITIQRDRSIMDLDVVLGASK